MTVRIERDDLDAAGMRALAARDGDARRARRLLALALVLEGRDRADAARSCGMDRQTLRDWVLRYNRLGVEGLADRPHGGGTEEHWDTSYFMDGSTFWANLISDPKTAFQAGNWVLVEVGTLHFNSALANDVTPYSTLDVGWVIKSVSARSTGI